jgi:prophage DNA circulation protein
MTCLCIDELRPASFRGAAFFVANDTGEYGRRDIVHEYPMRDDAYIEDMGQKATKFSVQGYLAGDDWIAQKNALVAACTARGPGMLQLPTESPQLVACLTLHVSRSKDECGFYSVKLECVAAKNFTSGTALSGAVGAFESQIGAVFNSAIPALTSFFDANYVSTNVQQYVIDNQMQRVIGFASAAIDLVESSPTVNADLSTDAVQAAISIFQNADDYVQPGTDGSIYLAQQPIVAQTVGAVANDVGVKTVSETGVTVTSAASAIVPMVAYVVNTLGNSMSADDAVNALTTLSSFSVNEVTLAKLKTEVTANLTIPSTVSVSDTSDAANSGAFCGMVRSFALMKLAQAITAKTFLTRGEAIQARANVVELFNDQIAQFEEDEIVNIMLSARDLCVTAISQKMVSIVPILNITAAATKPSLYWASRLYDDANRAEELSDRNGVVNPGFMPRNFEALAR